MELDYETMVKLDYVFLIACNEGNINTVKECLEHGVDIDIRYSQYEQNEQEIFNGATALILASENGHIEIVRLLIELGAKLDLTNDAWETALFRASYIGFTDITKILLENGTGFNHSNICYDLNYPIPTILYIIETECKNKKKHSDDYAEIIDLLKIAINKELILSKHIAKVSTEEFTYSI